MKVSDRFIKASQDMRDFEHYVPAPCLRKTFARAWNPSGRKSPSAAWGLYELYVKGKNSSKGPLCQPPGRRLLLRPV